MRVLTQRRALGRFLRSVVQSGGTRVLVLAYDKRHARQIASVLNDSEKAGLDVSLIVLTFELERELRALAIPHKPLDEAIGARDYDSYHEDAKPWVRGWYKVRTDGDREDITDYEGVSLGFMVEHDMWTFLADVVRSVQGMQSIIDAEKPDGILVIENEIGAVRDIIPEEGENLYAGAAKTVAGHRKVPLMSIRPRRRVPRIWTRVTETRRTPTVVGGRRFVLPVPLWIWGPVRAFMTLASNSRSGTRPPSRTGADARLPPQLASASHQGKTILMPEVDSLRYIGEPVMDALLEGEKDRILLLTKRRSVLGKRRGGPTKANFHYVALEDYRTGESTRKVKEAKRRFSDTFTRFESTLADDMVVGELPIWELMKDRVSFLFSDRFVQTVEYIETLKNVLSKERVDIVVSPLDTWEFMRTVVTVANQEGVPTLVLQHGLTLVPAGWVPVLADKFAAYGEQSRRWMIDHGVPDEKLVITGGSRWDLLVRGGGPAQKARICQELNLDMDKRLVLLPLPTVPESAKRQVNWEGHPGWYQDFLREVLRTFQPWSDTQLVMKLHPGDETGHWTKEVVDQMGVENVRLLWGPLRNYDLFKLFPIVDLTIVDFSAAGLEALVADKPVVCANMSGMGVVPPYAETDMVLTIKGVEEFGPVVKSALYDESVRERLTQARREQAWYHGYMPEEGTAKRIAALVDEMIQQARRH